MSKKIWLALPNGHFTASNG